MGAGEGRYAEVVYTTLPVLVEMTIWRFAPPICRSFGLKFALCGKLTAFARPMPWLWVDRGESRENIQLWPSVSPRGALHLLSLGLRCSRL